MLELSRGHYFDLSGSVFPIKGVQALLRRSIAFVEKLRELSDQEAKHAADIEEIARRKAPSCPKCGSTNFIKTEVTLENEAWGAAGMLMDGLVVGLILRSMGAQRFLVRKCQDCGYAVKLSAGRSAYSKDTTPLEEI